MVPPTILIWKMIKYFVKLKIYIYLIIVWLNLAMLPPSRAFKWKLKKNEKSKISNIWNKMHGTSYDSHLKNDQTFCKIKNIYIYLIIIWLNLAMLPP